MEEKDPARRLRIETTLMMVNEIDSELMHGKILKYIAPRFYVEINGWLRSDGEKVKKIVKKK